MTEENTQKIVIDDVEYAVKDLSEDAIKLINVISKSNQKEADLAFEIEQLKIARQVVFDNLKQHLPKKEEEDEQSD